MLKKSVLRRENQVLGGSFKTDFA